LASFTLNNKASAQQNPQGAGVASPKPGRQEHLEAEVRRSWVAAKLASAGLKLGRAKPSKRAHPEGI
jgi:hypothetical protein